MKTRGNRMNPPKTNPKKMVTISEYLGYLFSEITRARQLADRESVEIAKVYAKDPYLKYFSVPRFKVPELNLSIPVLVSEAKYQGVFSIQMEESSFLKLYQEDLFMDLLQVGLTNRDVNPFKAHFEAIKDMFNKLKKSIETQSFDNIGKYVGEWILKIRDFTIHLLTKEGIYPKYQAKFPNDDLLIRFHSKMQKIIESSIKVVSSKLNDVFVNPETSIVKDGTSDTSFFRINAKVVEEGIFIESVKDDRGGSVPVINFE
jgi:hypothetical protein